MSAGSSMEVATGRGPVDGQFNSAPALQKTCGRCHEVKPVEDFPFKVKIRGTRHSYCRPCGKAYINAHYERYKVLYFAKREKYRKRGLSITDAIKNVPCMDCGQSFPPYVMDLDHRPGEEKFRPLSQMLDFSEEAMMAEAAKCDVVCSNCHRIRTYNRRQIHSRVG